MTSKLSTWPKVFARLGCWQPCAKWDVPIKHNSGVFNIPLSKSKLKRIPPTNFLLILYLKSYVPISRFLFPEVRTHCRIRTRTILNAILYAKFQYLAAELETTPWDLQERSQVHLAKPSQSTVPGTRQTSCCRRHSLTPCPSAASWNQDFPHLIQWDVEQELTWAHRVAESSHENTPRAGQCLCAQTQQAGLEFPQPSPFGGWFLKDEIGHYSQFLIPNTWLVLLWWHKIPTWYCCIRLQTSTHPSGEVIILPFPKGPPLYFVLSCNTTVVFVRNKYWLSWTLPHNRRGPWVHLSQIIFFSLVI